MENVSILREITTADANNIVSFYKPKQGNSGYITTLKLKIDINSIDEASFPYIPDDTPPDVLESILNEVALNTQSKEIKLYFRKAGGAWIERCSMQLFNKNPYYDVGLIRLFSDANTVDCAQDFELGIQISLGPQNQLTATDKILVWGSSVEEEIVSNKICGEIIAFAGSNPPNGWLLCDGREYPIAIYPRLATVLGTTWGALTNGSGAAGTTHFRIPDLRGRAPIGSGQGSGLTNRALGAAIGAETHTLTTTEMPAHTHVQDAHNHTQNPHTHNYNWFAAPNTANGLSTAVGNLSPQANIAATNATTATNNAATATNQNTGGGQAHNNMQPSAVVNWLIYAG